MIHEATRYMQYQSYRQRKGDAIEMKGKLYLRIILLINNMREENLCVYVEQSPVKHAAARFSVRKKCHKKERKKGIKRVTPG